MDFLVYTLPIIYFTVIGTVIYMIYVIAKNSNVQTKLLQEILAELRRKNHGDGGM